MAPMAPLHRPRRWISGAAAAVSALAACAHGGGGAPIATRGAGRAAGEVRAIDWQNHTYALDELGPVTVKNGTAEFAISDDNKAAETGAGSGSYRVDPPLYAD